MTRRRLLQGLLAAGIWTAFRGRGFAAQPSSMKEIDELHAAIVREGEQEKSRIIAEANSAAEKIVAQAALSAEQETVKACNELRAEAARLAVEIATGKRVYARVGERQRAWARLAERAGALAQDRKPLQIDAENDRARDDESRQ